MAELESMVAASTQLYNKLPTGAQPAFFQLLHHPILATDTLTLMWISAGMNNLRASQARLSANDLATDVENLFMQDAQLEADYHSLLDGASHSVWNLRERPLISNAYRQMVCVAARSCAGAVLTGV